MFLTNVANIFFLKFKMGHGISIMYENDVQTKD